jgi:hypothetical protein
MTKKCPAEPRKLAALLSLLVVAFLLSGCFKFNMDLEVSNQDTVSGTAVVALSKELQAFAEESGGGEEPTDAFDEVDRAEVSDFDDGSFVGQQYEFNAIPIEEFSLNDDESALKIERDGDKLVVSGNFSLEDEAADADAGEDFGFGQAFVDSADLRVTMKFPGDIRETNGEVDEDTNTITWIPKYGEANELSAVVYSPKGIPQWVWWVVGAALGTSLIVAGLLFARKHRRTVVQGNEHSPSAGGSNKADSSETIAGRDVGPRRTGRPVFSYQVRSGPFAKEAFELRLFEDEVDFAFIDKSGTPTTDLVTIPIGSIESATVLEGRAGLGVRLVHSGKVEMLPAKMDDAKTLVSLVKSLRVSKSSDKSAPNNAGDANSRPTAQTTGHVQSPPTQASISEDIRQFGQLLEDGLITPEEFARMKEKRIADG